MVSIQAIAYTINLTHRILIKYCEVLHDIDVDRHLLSQNQQNTHF